ncbi:MAG: thioesterase family protein [Actinomycetota bacterium]
MRVRYSETDAQGIVNNASYLSYFEVGRVEWLRDAGLSYAELEREGYGFVVVEARVFYHRAARFDDELVLGTRLSELGRASLRFDYEVLRGGAAVATGYTRHACIRLSSGRAARIPKGVMGALKTGGG